MRGGAIYGAGNTATQYLTTQLDKSGSRPSKGASSKTPPIRADVKVAGGRSGQNVKTATGPPNSIIRGSEGRIFRTNDAGEVVSDITRERVKPVEPGQGFGNKRPPNEEELGWLDKMDKAIKKDAKGDPQG
jgi:hypothetical protein